MKKKAEQVITCTEKLKKNENVIQKYQKISLLIFCTEITKLENEDSKNNFKGIMNKND